jgi:hypothetical protein
MAGLLKCWAVADCCLLFYWMLPLQRQPKIIQMHSHNINRHRPPHSWELVPSSGSSNCCWEPIPSTGYIGSCQSLTTGNTSRLVALIRLISYCIILLVFLTRSIIQSLIPPPLLLLVVVRALADPQQLVCSAYLSRCITCHGLMVLFLSSSSPNSLLQFTPAVDRSIRGFVLSCCAIMALLHFFVTSSGIINRTLRIVPKLIRTPTTSQCGLQIAPLCAVGFNNPLL